MTIDPVSIETPSEYGSEIPLIDRREVRIHCRLTVEFNHGSLSDYGICWNLGLNGMYISYESVVAQGEPIEISFVLSDEYPALVEASGRVVWSNIGNRHTQKQLPEGFGVKFTSLSNDARSAIRKFIDHS